METETNTRPLLIPLILTLLMAALAAGVTTCEPAKATPHQKVAAAPPAIERSVPRVTVIDNTGGLWGRHPVRDAVEAWDRSPRIDIRLGLEPVPGTYTAYVQAWDYNDTGWAGLASDLGNGAMVIQLNTNNRMDRDQRTSIIAHELGHVLGIPHPDEHADHGVSGVIAGTPGGRDTVLPTGADYAAMNRAAEVRELGVWKWEDASRG
ncbi:hypothetical protein SAMN05428985_11044 [Nocardioides sp. YR527]|uniref:hypothetical protein n=1 Tax=Nocardioides sp. YR527 TaxID=1881028 RepID=UPI0008874F6D|nr:hypothetical protein [Nocardioides sp. YR527]SDL14585.1 hypothetical protein SAMN05428985_11044 [Nocardioides sp. YR527]